jgi:hypothetical protein
MKAFQRVDHLLCDVPDIDSAFSLFHERLGFPVAWPIGRFWPDRRTCGLALGGINLELIQSDVQPVSEATIRSIAFEPTDRIQEIFQREGIPFKEFEKWESNPDLLRLRNMPSQQGAQLLCTNTLPAEYAIAFPFFACKYAVTVKRKLAPHALPLPDGNVIEEIVLGHPDPAAIKDQLQRLGIQEGVRISVARHPKKEVTALLMKNGAIDLGTWPTSISFISGVR